jgi:DNA-binding transcriptional LysR family regulator
LHDWIAFTAIPHPWTLQTRDGKDSVRLKGTLSTSSTAGGCALAKAGAGVFAAPQFALESEVASGGLVRLLPAVKLPQVTLYAAWPGRHLPPTKTREFIELAKARLGSAGRRSKA